MKPALERKDGTESAGVVQYSEFIEHYEPFEHPFAENFRSTTVSASTLLSFYL